MISQRPNQSVTCDGGRKRPFSIMDLAPLNQQPPPAYQPPTPPPDDEDDEAMDWTPSQENKTLRPATAYRTPNAESQLPEPLSYRDKLSATAQTQPISLRISPKQPMFRKDVDLRRREHLQTPKKYAMRDPSDESPFATPYEPSIAAGSPDLSPIKFAQPRFFPHTDREELGLESLMAQNFSLAEEPHEVRAHQRKGNREAETQSKMSHVYSQWHGPVAVVLLAIACVIWRDTRILSLTAFRMHFRLAALCIAALVILKNLVLTVRRDSALSVSDIVLLGSELTTTIMLGAALRHRAATSGSEDSTGPLEKPGIILIAVLIAQEVWMLYSGIGVPQASIKDVPTPSGSQATAAPSKADRQKPFAGSSMSSSRHDPKISVGTDSNGRPFPAPSQRTTRAQTKSKHGNHAQGGFNNVSLGGNARNEQASGINSLNLGQPQIRNRNGMW